ncbi:hypothetical protein NDK50_34925 [Paraburkholderia bryophila]|uniref:hypothetical protein n=1 Tax=Paraburkholderia bryophila TaxID=420952 RepID=UPI00234985D7|nr:hypothetical protein [Paraburkholderia bryophila]WCM23146.1 hypothetical protein NDK50_34925 [Paraburkholderia bryophila]
MDRADENRLRFDVSAIKAHRQGAIALPAFSRIFDRSCGCEAGPIKGANAGCFPQGRERSELRFPFACARVLFFLFVFIVLKEFFRGWEIHVQQGFDGSQSS